MFIQFARGHVRSGDVISRQRKSAFLIAEHEFLVCKERGIGIGRLGEKSDSFKGYRVDL
jgi:hypothetical protein